MLHAGTTLKSWFNKFLSFCMRQFKLPKIWRRALVVAIVKPNKPTADPKSYRSISLLCIAYKIWEKLIYARVTPIMDQLPPRKQAGFRRGKSTGDQIIFLTQKIEDTFSVKKKAGAVFVKLTGTCDTARHRGSISKIVPDSHMISMIMDLIRNRSFTFTIGSKS